MTIDICSISRMFGKFRTASLAFCIAATGCASLPDINVNLLSTQEEIELGRKVSAEIEKKETVLQDEAVQSYVRGIGVNLARFSPRQDVEYTFKVIDAPDKVNAFALPGGYMYIYTGLMRLCENEAELAGVMAHEIGHVAGHHHGESMTRQFGYNLIMSIVLGEDAGAVSQIAAQFAGTAGAMYYSRGNEREADSIGMDIAVRADYNPTGMISFMGKLLEQERKRGGGPPLPIFASHPPTEERVERLTVLMREHPTANLDPAALFETRYQTRALRRIGK